jgi:type II secretory pathway pseudopilin PulG
VIVSHGKIGKWAGLGVVAALLAGMAPTARAQGKSAPAAKSDPAAALAATLTAACRRDEMAFAVHLTSQTAALFRKLPESQRGTLMGRLAMLNAAGKALLSSSADGRAVVRCDAAGAITELRLGVPETSENLAFVPVDAHAVDASRTVRFGLVREAGDWRLISVGLLLLDLPAMSQEWAEADVRASEVNAVAALRDIADALDTYRKAFDRLPESLEQLGPAPKDGLSPDHANLLDEMLAAGQSGDYRFRYVIVSAGPSVDEADRDKLAGFALAATPLKYGQGGRRSFYLGSAGILRGADKQGEVATSNDPEIDEPRP